jgi:hypothetical protein
MSGRFLAWARRTAILSVGLLGLLTVVDYVAGVNSDALAFATPHIQESSALQNRLGRITSVRLRPLWGFKYKSGFANDSVQLSLRVEGTQAATDLQLKLEGQDDDWRIVESSLPLK